LSATPPALRGADEMAPAPKWCHNAAARTATVQTRRRCPSKCLISSLSSWHSACTGTALRRTTQSAIPFSSGGDMTPAEVLKLIKEKEIKFADLRFTDTRGKEQHVTIPARLVDEDLFRDGKMFDGSSIAGWKGINESDMI